MGLQLFSQPLRSAGGGEPGLLTRAGGDVIFLVNPSPWFDARSWVTTLENGEPSYLRGGLAEEVSEEKDWTKSDARRAKMRQNRDDFKFS